MFWVLLSVFSVFLSRMWLTEISASSLIVWTLTSRRVWQKSWTERHPRSLRNWRTFVLATPSKLYTFIGGHCTHKSCCATVCPFGHTFTDIYALLYDWLWTDKHGDILQAVTCILIHCSIRMQLICTYSKTNTCTQQSVWTFTHMAVSTVLTTHTHTPLCVIMTGSLGLQPSYISRFCSQSFLHSHVQLCEQHCHTNTAVWTELTHTRQRKDQLHCHLHPQSTYTLNPNHLSSSVKKWIHFI